MHRSETFSFFPRDIRSLKLQVGRPFKARAHTIDGSSTATSVPSSPPATRTPVLSRLPASIQHLPTEIVLSILGFVLPVVYTRAYEFRASPNAFFEEVERCPSFRRVLKETQGTLHHAALVCRAWYPAATNLLYACPFLRSPNSATALSRTLQAAPDLRPHVRSVWLFSEEKTKLFDPLGLKRKGMQRTQASLISTLRAHTSLDAVIVCAFGLLGQDNGREYYPIDNVMVYGLPETAGPDHIPTLALYGPSFFNKPWTRHAKPRNLIPAELTTLCMRDIAPSPATLKCAPYLPTLPHVHTLQLAMMRRNEMPIVSSGTLPALRALEVYRDIFDGTELEDFRTVAVEEVVLAHLERLHLVGRAPEATLFWQWASRSEGERFAQLRVLVVGPLHAAESEWMEDWRFPERLETFTVVLACPCATGKKDAEKAREDTEGMLRILQACVHRNRQSRAFKRLIVRATGALPSNTSGVVEELEETCAIHDFSFELFQGGAFLNQSLLINLTDCQGS